MTTVILNGMPKETKKPKVVSFLRAAFRKNGIGSDYWVTKCVDVPGSKFKRITISFSNAGNALFATEILDNFEYMATNGVYRLSACIESESQDTEIGDQRMQAPARKRKSINTKLPPQAINQQRAQTFSSDDGQCTYNNYESARGHRNGNRSQNPRSQEVDALLQNSLEMKLLMKKRMILEEEQRLLLEEKKLKLVQERANASKGIEHGLESRKSGASQPPPQPQTKPRFKQKDLSGRPLYKRPSANYLPRFSMPCRYLLKEMQSPMSKYWSDKSTRKALADLLRLKIRSRINAAIELQPRYMLSKEIYSLYRSQYPKSTDAEFVKSVAKDIERNQARQLRQSAYEAEQTGTNDGEQIWFTDTVGEGSSANVIEEVPDIADDAIDADFDPNDVEDWGVEDDINTAVDNESIQV